MLIGDAEMRCNFTITDGYYTPPAVLSTIDLTRAEPARCRLEVGKRCLIVGFERAVYPAGAVARGAPGRIRLTGLIRRNGRVTDIKVLEADTRATNGRKVLTKAAAADLTTWRFDTGKGDEAFSVTYSYERDSRDYSADSTAEWVPPNEVSVRAGRSTRSAQ